MQQGQRIINPWLLSYIRHHRRVESRYQIDQVLLKAGYDAGEIELIWEVLADEPVIPHVPVDRPRKGTAFFIFASLSAVVALVCLFAGHSPVANPSLAEREAAFYLAFMFVALVLIVGLNLGSLYLNSKGRKLDGCVLLFFYCYSLTFVLIGCMSNFWKSQGGIIDFTNLPSVSNLLTISLLATALFSFAALRRQSQSSKLS